MKISASIYSSSNRTLEDVVTDLDAHHVDLLHVDCNDDTAVFDDIAAIRNYSGTPIDLHIITPSPGKYRALLETHPVEYVTYQHEDLEEQIELPEDFKGKVGIAFTSETDISVFEQYKDMADFVLFMATVPGQSGGTFDPRNFQKIRAFRKKYPNKRVHVDGGVNAEVSFILRNMGVYASVSGSYLFKEKTVGAAMLNLKLSDSDSHFKVSDFMIHKDACPVVPLGASFKEVLASIDEHKLGFTMLEKDGELEGIVSNADLRKSLLNHVDDLTAVNVEEMVNTDPITVGEGANVREMLRLLKSYPFPIMYLPVVDSQNKIKGAITFLNLIKGEL